MDKKLALAFLALIISSTSSAKNKIENYQRGFQECTHEEKTLLSLRKFKMNNIDSYLLLDTDTLQSTIKSAAEVICSPIEVPTFINSYYEKLRNYSAQNKDLISNAGLNAFASSQLFLTIDLCPSSHPLNKTLFNWIRNHNIPIGISVSGNWIQNHIKELEEIRALPNSITWINHTFNHPYAPHRSIKRNFLLSEGINLEDEIINNEVLMIENGITPSVFVRFPGLVSNRAIVDQIIEWGLIPIGADVWFAPKQSIKPGGLVLVHGNGNDSEGVVNFFKAIRDMSQFAFRELTSN